MNGDGNFKARCVSEVLTLCNKKFYTNNKIYEVINGEWKDDTGELMGGNDIKTIDDLNKHSVFKWELVEEETPKPVKEEKTLLEIVMEYLGVTEGEEFNIVWGSGNDSSLSTLNPFMFKDGELLNNYQNSSDNYLGWLITGAYKIEKLKWKPKNGDRVWTVYLDENKNSWCNCFGFQKSSLHCIALYKLGWLFRTKEEAEANMERIVREMREVKEND